MARRIHHVGNMRVRIPKGANGLSTAHRQALSLLMSNETLRKDKKCTVFFVRGRGRPKAIQRCEDRKLKATNRRQCRRGGKGPKKHLFAKCR